MKRAVIVALVLSTACGPRPVSDVVPPLLRPAIEEQTSGVTALLQAVSVVDSNVVWISGHDATVVRTSNGGASWIVRPVNGAPDSLQFRDIHAFDATTAYILAAGPGDMSRIYRTDNGGANWTLQWTNPEPAGFYDCFDFWDRRHGVVYGDAVEGGLRVLTTDDGGRTWRRVPDEGLPAALPGEGGFAASGLCVDTQPEGHAWIAAGNAARARVFHSSDWGRSWSAADAPVIAGEAAGLTSISMVDEQRGFAFGGNLAVTDRTTDNVATTIDGGRSWTGPRQVSFNGAIYGGLRIPALSDLLLAVGPGGVAFNQFGDGWATIDSRAWWGVGSSGIDATWIAGPDGRIARVRWLEGR